MSWRPVHENHAIERFGFVVSLQDEIPLKMMPSLTSKAYAQLLSEGFSTFLPQNIGSELVINIVNGIPQAINAKDQTHGFRLIRGAQFIEEFVFGRNFCAYTSYRYSRWSPIRKRIISILGEYIDGIKAITNVSVVKLEYLDRFIFDGSPLEADYKGAINENTHLLPKFYLDTHGLWHSHVGFFSTGKHGQQRLINANVDAADVNPPPGSPFSASEPLRSLGIFTLGEDRYMASRTPSPEGSNAVMAVADEIHEELKDVLRHIINYELADLVSLKPEGD